MNKKKILGDILQAPLVLLVVISFLASIYLAYNNLYGITYASGVILGILIALYIAGTFVKKEKKQVPTTSVLTFAK